jgi:hypothetical protein
MHLCSDYYGWPLKSSIDDYAEELAQMLRDGYVAEYEFGFKKDERRVLSWRYVVRSDGSLASAGDRAGKLISSANVADATFFNFMTYSFKWSLLPAADRTKKKEGLPIQRTTGEPPADGNGYWLSQDRNYSSGGTNLERATFRPY